VRQLADQIGQQQPLAQVVGGSEFARPDFSAYLAGKIRAEAVWWTIDVALSGVAALASATWLLSRHRALAATYGASPTLLDTSESQRV
jgi:hypothetical protein